MTNKIKKGCLIIAHGSKVKKFNHDFLQLVGQLKMILKDMPITASFLDCVKPSITDGLEFLETKEATEILVIPYFLGKGKHLTIHIPQILKSWEKTRPHIKIKTTKPIGQDSIMLPLLLSLVRQNLIHAQSTQSTRNTRQKIHPVKKQRSKNKKDNIKNY